MGAAQAPQSHPRIAAQADRSSSTQSAAAMVMPSATQDSHELPCSAKHSSNNCCALEHSVLITGAGAMTGEAKGANVGGGTGTSVGGGTGGSAVAPDVAVGGEGAVGAGVGTTVGRAVAETGAKEGVDEGASESIIDGVPEGSSVGSAVAVQSTGQPKLVATTQPNQSSISAAQASHSGQAAMASQTAAAYTEQSTVSRGN